MSPKEIIEKLASEADIKIDGDKPWDIRVHNEELYDRVIRHGSLGLGESYMDGWWDAESLDEFFNKLLKAGFTGKIPMNTSFVLGYLRQRFLNIQKGHSFEIGERHYDIGNDIYESMLDKRLTYTCAYWKEAKTLDEAQEAKLDLVCRKLGIKKGQKVLDIGSGWGSFMGYAAEKYGAECVGVTVSKKQVDYANKRYAHLPVETRLTDYRDINGQFDHVVSLGMFEHVGHKNYGFYMKKVRELLKDGGLFLLHTIGKNVSNTYADPWISRYIFPNSIIPSAKQIADSSESLFVMEDWHNFGADYDATLIDWFKNFDTAWPKLKAKYGQRFYRMWKYYLLMSAGSFRCRKNQLWQTVFSKDGVPGGYRSAR